MTSLLESQERQLFPCPLCGEGLDIRESKKGKPYVVCYGCGLQMFVRIEPGIRRLEELVASAEKRNIWERLADLEGRYRKRCPACGRRFWVESDLIEANWMHGGFRGFRCPNEECGEIVPWGEKP